MVPGVRRSARGEAQAARELQERVQELEGGLIRQEHRLSHAIANFFRYFRPADPDDRRRNAAIQALCWNVLPRWIVIGGVAFTATWVTVYITATQNELIEAQNLRIDLQNHLVESQRRSSLVFELSAILVAFPPKSVPS